MPTTTATILTHKLKNPDFSATATDSAVWMPLAEIQKTTTATDAFGTTTSYTVIFSGELKDNSVTLNKLAPKYAASQEYKNSIPTSAPSLDLTHYLTIPTGAISTETIDSEAITIDKIADNAITTNKIADNAITTDKIADKAITSSKIEENIIYDRHIAPIDLTITPPYSGVDGQKIKDSSLTLNKLNTRLKGVFINSVNPDDMIKIDQISTSNSYSVVSNDLSWFEMELSEKDNTTYILKARYTSPDLISYNLENNTLSFAPLSFFLYNSSDLKNSISTIEIHDSNIDTTEEFRVLSKIYFINKVVTEIYPQIVSYWENNKSNLSINENLLQTIFSTISIQSAYYDSTKSDSSNLFKNEILYATKDEFENTLISKTDYDNIGIWIKI